VVEVEEEPNRVVVVEDPVVVVVEWGGAVVVVAEPANVVVVVVDGRVDDDVGVVWAGAVVVGVGGWVVVVVAGTSPGMMSFGLFVVIVVTVLDAGGYRYIKVPKPTKPISMRTVERRMAMDRDTGSAMRPTRALWGGLARMTSPVGLGTCSSAFFVAFSSVGAPASVGAPVSVGASMSVAASTSSTGSSELMGHPG
jgi:hypothetical protein